jgi:membrane associated rhomboid family serine protease
LVVISILIFVIAQSTKGTQTDLLMMYFVDNPKHRVWQYLTHIFMHGSVNHILFNMFGLWMFGQVLEKVWGAKKFLFFYLACGIGAALIYMFIQKYQFNVLMGEVLSSGISSEEAKNLFASNRYLPSIPSTETAGRIFATPMVGASGAIYGVLVAFALLFPNHKLMLIFLPVPIAAKFFVPAILLLDLFSGVTGVSIFGGGNIAHFAHIGGATIGFILMMMWRNKARKTNFLNYRT